MAYGELEAMSGKGLVNTAQIGTSQGGQWEDASAAYIRKKKKSCELLISQVFASSWEICKFQKVVL